MRSSHDASGAEHIVVGVLGGMGPDATVAFMQQVIQATPAEDDIDHVHMVIDNNPKVPSRIKALLEGGDVSPGPAIAEMAQRLEQSGCDFLVMPCNTAHYYWQDAQDAVSIPVWHIVERTLDRVAAQWPGARVGMLCSPALRKIGLYEGFIAARGLSLAYPQDEDAMLEVIRSVKKGQVSDDAVGGAFRQAAADLVAQEADVLVLACTELSIISHLLDDRLPIVDSVEALAVSVAQAATQ